MDDFFEFLPLFVGLFAFYGVLIVVAIASYVLQGLGIMRMSAALGFRNGWLGFIPYANAYQLGHMAGEIELGRRRVRNPGLWLAIAPLILGGIIGGLYVFMVFGVIGAAAGASYSYDMERRLASMMGGMFIVMMLIYLVLYAVSIVIAILRLMVYHRIFGYFYADTLSVFYMLLSAFVPLASGILMMRTAKLPVMRPPAHSEYGWQPVSPSPYQPDPYASYGQPPTQGPPPESGGPPQDPPAAP